MWSCSKRLAYMVAILFAKREREEEAKRERETTEQPAQALLQHRVHFPESAEKRPSR